MVGPHSGVDVLMPLNHVLQMVRRLPRFYHNVRKPGTAKCTVSAGSASEGHSYRGQPRHRSGDPSALGKPPGQWRWGEGFTALGKVPLKDTETVRGFPLPHPQANARLSPCRTDSQDKAVHTGPPGSAPRPGEGSPTGRKGASSFLPVTIQENLVFC